MAVLNRIDRDEWKKGKEQYAKIAARIYLLWFIGIGVGVVGLKFERVQIASITLNIEKPQIIQGLFFVAVCVCYLIMPGFPRWLPNWGGYSRFTGLSARQKCGPGGYRQLGRPERWSRGLSGHFRWYLDTLLPSVAVERMTIGRLTQALVAAVAGVPQSGAVSLGTIHSAPRLRPSGR